MHIFECLVSVPLLHKQRATVVATAGFQHNAKVTQSPITNNSKDYDYQNSNDNCSSCPTICCHYALQFYVHTIVHFLSYENHVCHFALQHEWFLLLELEQRLRFFSVIW